MPDFQTRDPSAPEFWSERFERNFTPWDKGGIPQELRAFVERNPPLATLIPGCGAGYEVALLSEAGWDVTAIDFSEAAVAAARAILGPWGKHVQHADFFTYTPSKPVELIYERAFFCALPKHMRPAVVQRWAELLRPGSLVAGYFFFGEAPKGPPFGIAPTELDQLLAPFFERIEDQPVSDSLPVFAGKERWQIWRRLA